MNFISTDIDGLYIIEPKVFKDERGYFFESFNQKEFSEKSLSYSYCQDNQSKSCFSVIRGLHYQIEPYAQTKLVRVVQGKIFDVAADMRINSPTYGRWYGVELSCENKRQFYIPKGFAHGFSVLSETAIVFYKCDSLYAPSAERGIHVFDKHLNIDWKIDKEKAIISQKDRANIGIHEVENNFHYKK